MADSPHVFKGVHTDFGTLGGGEPVAKAKLEELRKFRLRHWKPGTELRDPATGDVGVIQPNGDLVIKWRAARAFRAGGVPVTVDIAKGRKLAPDLYAPGDSRSAEGMQKAKKAMDEFQRRNFR